MTKYQQYFQKMVEIEKQAFDNFRQLHDAYALNPQGLQAEFNREGEKILLLIHNWENKLCLQSEKAGYGSYTTNLAEKFQAEVRKHFPQIDNIGLKIDNNNNPNITAFQIKKINLA